MRALFALSLLTVAALAGCVDDPDADDAGHPVPAIEWQSGPGSHPDHGFPVRDDLPTVGDAVTGLPADWFAPRGVELPDSVSSLAYAAGVGDVESGSGIAIFGSYAYVGSYNTSDLWVVDISDLSEPFVRGHVEVPAGDIDIIAYPPTQERPDGRLVIVAATRAQSINIVDVTDPDDPGLIGTIETTQGNHNLQVVPGTPILYNAASDGADNYAGGDTVPAPGLVGDPTQAPAGSNDIWDLSDPERPVHVMDFENGYGCHAIDFYINATEGKYRGYCAGIEVTQIWDVSNATDPQVISTFPFPVGGVEAPVGQGGVAVASFSHLAMPNHDGTVLIVGDETGGGAGPGCDLYAEPPTGGTVTGPIGNLWFYDVSDEENPVLHGSYSPSASEERGGCTAHFGDLLPDRDMLVMAFYTVGVALVDFSDLDDPREVDIWQPGEVTEACVLCGVWDAQVYQGHVITGDITRGMDLLTFE